jgi:hypothetical protein
MAKYYVTNKKFSLEAGPQVGFISAKNKYGYTGTVQGVPVSESGEIV